MKLPICTFCAKTGMLCSNCKFKLEQDEINTLDVEISKILVKNQNNKLFQKSKFFYSIDTPNLVIIIGDSSLKESIIKNDQVANALTKVIHKTYELVIKEGTVKDTLSALFAPVEVYSIDEIFVPDGTKEIRINLRGAEKDLPLNSKDLILISSKITSSLIRLEFTSAS